MTLEQLFAHIDEFFSDRNRTARQTLNGLEEARDHCDIRADCIRDDLSIEEEG